MEANLTFSKRIVITHNSIIPKDYLDELYDDLLNLTPDVEVEVEDPGPQGAVDWVLPAAIFLLLGKGLLDGFLKEFGADAAKSLKNIVGKLFSRAKEKPVQWFSPEGKPKGISPPFSIEIVLEDKNFYQAIKFIFPSELDEVSVLLALEQLPNAIGKAVLSEQVYLKQSGGAFLGSRCIDYVYLPNHPEWMEITAKLIISEQNLKKELKEKNNSYKSKKRIK